MDSSLTQAETPGPLGLTSRGQALSDVSLFHVWPLGWGPNGSEPGEVA